MGKESLQPTENLRRVLRTFRAPKDAEMSIKRRAGLVVANGQLSTEQIRSTIISSMSDNSGLPNWPEVSQRVGKAVNFIYRDLRQSW
ncbi:MAG: hypothetical protein Q8P29_01340 [Candidatus Levybacteria bacterium]|nr:hypothetical protein [Candidatus Levybacteria bacterium]